MMRMVVRTSLCTLAAVALLASTTRAQEPSATRYKQVVSANPFGLLLNLANGEYERVVSGTTTAGFGGSYFTADDVRYGNGDVFLRYYPQGKPLQGWAFGVKVGVTGISDKTDAEFVEPVSGTYFGYGFDVNRSWLLGKNDNFYVGLGFGLKRLVGVDENSNADILEYIPTFRIVNIGFAF